VFLQTAVVPFIPPESQFPDGHVSLEQVRCREALRQVHLRRETIREDLHLRRPERHHLWGKLREADRKGVGAKTVISPLCGCVFSLELSIACESHCFFFFFWTLLSVWFQIEEETKTGMDLEGRTLRGRAWELGQWRPSRGWRRPCKRRDWCGVGVVGFGGGARGRGTSARRRRKRIIERR
jgi:hypothetical protein